tara:strand:- start:388 stop:555 length:168 start_codon:yes stop_codon:yes gene_type:complete
MINRSQLGKTTMDNISSKRIRPSRPKALIKKKKPKTKLISKKGRMFNATLGKGIR